MKKLLTSGIEAGNKVKAVREVVKTYKTQKQDMYDDTKEILKPQKKVKETIDEKQNKLIKKLQENKETVDRKQDEVINQLKENQVNITKSVDVLSEIMSQKGSQEGSLSRVKTWLEGQPSDYESLDIIGEEDEEEAKPKPLKTLFDNSDTEIIKKYGFDPTLNTIPENEEIQKNIIFLDRQNESHKSNY